jgi:hypothetical protein
MFCPNWPLTGVQVVLKESAFLLSYLGLFLCWFYALATYMFGLRFSWFVDFSLVSHVSVLCVIVHI